MGLCAVTTLTTCSLNPTQAFQHAVQAQQKRLYVHASSAQGRRWGVSEGRP